MKRVQVLVLERDIHSVTEGLGRLGVIHLSEAKAVEGGELLNPAHLEDALSRAHALHERVAALCSTLEIGEDYPAADIPYARAEELGATLKDIEVRLTWLGEHRKRLEDEAEAEHEVLHTAEAFRAIEVPTYALHDLAFLHFAVGTMPSRAIETVSQAVGDRAVLLPFKSPDGRQRVAVLASRASQPALESALAENGFEAEQLPKGRSGTPAEISREAEERLLALAKEREAAQGEARALASEFGGRLAACRQRLRTDEQMIHAQLYFAQTSSTYLITGYVPLARVNPLREDLLRLTDGKAFIDVAEPPEDDPDIPTLMQNPRLLRPFQMLVGGYGCPGYREVEPTMLVGLSFLLMFGIMFGDVGQGAVLVALGFLLGRPSRSTTMRDFGTLLKLAGTMGMIFGWIGGSVFGVEGAVTPPWGGWFVAMEGENVQILLSAAVCLGVVMVSLGVILNLVNRARSRDFFALVVDKFGIVGFVFYWGALGLGIKTLVFHAAAPSTAEVVVLVGLPLLMLFFREPLHYLMTRKGHGGDHPEAHKPSLFGGLVEGFVEILETVSAYVANTLSFVRVGAFALAHAALCMAIFQTEEILRTMPGGAFWGVCVVVGGNALVIGLEGLVVSIQAVRLEYYEFFSKFFGGQGKAYQPFKLG
jgi:V/A-type H+-transporting ATPase subunit I